MGATIFTILGLFEPTIIYLFSIYLAISLTIYTYKQAFRRWKTLGFTRVKTPEEKLKQENYQNNNEALINPTTSKVGAVLGGSSILIVWLIGRMIYRAADSVGVGETVGISAIIFLGVFVLSCIPMVIMRFALDKKYRSTKTETAV